jgi:hypothetical protein
MLLESHVLKSDSYMRDRPYTQLSIWKYWLHTVLGRGYISVRNAALLPPRFGRVEQTHWSLWERLHQRRQAVLMRTGRVFNAKRSQRHLTNTTRINGSVYINVPDSASLCSAHCMEGIKELRERYKENVM